MNKRIKMVQGIDYLIYFIIILLIACGITTYHTLWLMLFFFILGITLMCNYYLTLKMRKELNNRITKEEKATANVENKLNDTEKQTFYKVKQEVLENIIEMELISNYSNAIIFKNVYCSKPDGTYSEIDILMISNDGIFIIEAKNISATISGDWNSEYLLAKYDNGKTVSLFNPILQNSTHYKHLKNILGISENNIFKNIIVFGDATYFDLQGVPPYASICNINGLHKTIKYRSERSKNILSDNKVNNISNLINKYLLKTDIKEKNHIEQIKNI